jgi:hypothetical protein
MEHTSVGTGFNHSSRERRCDCAGRWHQCLRECGSPGYAPSIGRFGIYARTGGEFQTHWLDDLSITRSDARIRGRRNGQSRKQCDHLHAAHDGVWPDSFFYIVSNGQLNGLNAGQVSVNFAAPLASKSLFFSPTLDASTISLKSGAFTAFFGTAKGTSYVIEYKNAITDEAWTPLTTVTGTGDLKSFTDPGPLPPTRFYRVRVE